MFHKNRAFMTSWTAARRHIFESPSGTGCAALLLTAQQPALNAHGVWRTPQPQLCLFWAHCSLSLCSAALPILNGESPVRTMWWSFFFLKCGFIQAHSTAASTRYSHCWRPPKLWFYLGLTDLPFPGINGTAVRSAKLSRNESWAYDGKPSASDPI